jgi:hypothetical protein
MLTPVGLAMLFRAFPPAERARASTLIMIPTLAHPRSGRCSGPHRHQRQLALDLPRQRPIGLLALWFGGAPLRSNDSRPPVGSTSRVRALRTCSGLDRLHTE